MTANELRIGNLVMDQNRKHIKVSTGMLSNWDIIQRNYRGYQPIEITGDRLVRFGFEKQKYDEYCIDLDEGWSELSIVLTDYSIAIWDITGKKQGIYPLFDVKIQYVHQVQNLVFALKGKELECN